MRLTVPSGTDTHQLLCLWVADALPVKVEVPLLVLEWQEETWCPQRETCITCDTDIYSA